MEMFLSMAAYLDVPIAEMQALDRDRRYAEEFSDSAQVWAVLVQRYEAQGRPEQAASCRRRAKHYASVSVETEPANATR